MERAPVAITRDCTQNLSRVNAIDHLLSTTVALVIAFAPRLNRVCTTCTTRGDPCTKFLNSSKLFPRPHRVQNCPRVCALVIRDCYAFYSLAISVLQRLLGVCHFFPAIQSRSTRGGLCDRAFTKHLKCGFMQDDGTYLSFPGRSSSQFLGRLLMRTNAPL